MAITTSAAQRDYQQSATPGGTPKTVGPITAAEIRRRWDDSQRATLKERRDWWVNTSMISGGDDQWVGWNFQENTLEPLMRDGDRTRITVNRLKSSARTIVAKGTRRPLVFDVPASSADDAASAGSRTAQAVLTDVSSRHNWEELRRQQWWHTIKGGTAVLCTEWDPRAQVDLGVDEDTGKHFGTGDTIESVLNVTQAATEPGCRDLEHARWWIKAVALPSRDVREMFDLPGDPPADASVLLSPLQRSLMGGSRISQTVPLTLVFSYYERPNRLCPKGQVAVAVDNKLVEPVSPWPFAFRDKLNAVVIRETPVDDRWTGETVMSDAVQIQCALNMSVSSLVEHMKLAGNARLAIPDGAGDEWDSLTDLPAELVHYAGQTPPEWMSPPSMPQWWVEQPQMLSGQIDDLLGQHDVSRGDAPPDVHSGVALNILAEQDDTPLGHMAKESAEGWGRLASLVLETYAEKVTDKRTATVQRQGSVPATVGWTGKDLAGQTTAVVPLDAVEPRSRAAQMQLALALKAQFGPEMDLKTFLRIADLPGGDDLSEAVDMDVVKARRENGEMAAGHMCLVAEFDDHAKHLQVLNEFRKSARYEALDGVRVIEADQIQALMADPSQIGPKTLIDVHALGHEVDAAREMGAQLARGRVNPAYAAAAQANEPPLAGDHAALMANAPGSATAPLPPGDPSNAQQPGQAIDANAQSVPQPGGPPA